MRNFERQLAAGNMGEKQAAAWLLSRGWGVIPSYEFSGASGDKAPRLTFADRRMAIPDLDLCRAGVRKWFEVKTYYRSWPNTRHAADIHGMSARLFNGYREVEAATGCEVWIAVLEVSTGDLLTVRASKLTPWPCQCKCCEDGRPSSCYADIKRGVYWPRSAMSVLNRFSDEEMAEIRAAWPVSDRAKGAA